MSEGLEKLAPCPFCGSPTLWDDGDLHVIHTEDCYLVYLFRQDHWITGRQIERWNRRALAAGTEGPGLPPFDAMRGLAGFVMHLDHDHDCDCHGWEERREMARKVNEWLDVALTRPAQETAWLIERRQDVSGEPPRYWAGGDFLGWTTDINDAIRFARREDALRVHDRHKGPILGYCNVVEHLWIDERHKEYSQKAVEIIPSRPAPADGAQELIDSLREDACADDDEGVPFYDAGLADEIIRKALTAPTAPTEGVREALAKQHCWACGTRFDASAEGFDKLLAALQTPESEGKEAGE